ncbi:MAG: PHP domain-containing protein, partial [Eubacteriales bacterium]|nr:PHP domain-containing protein [Eubacteriales bacterium]
AVLRNIDEIWLLEHCYRFIEFVPMYDEVCAYSGYIDEWFHRKAGVMNLYNYLELINNIRQRDYPVKINFGLEVCYFKKYESLVRELTNGKGLDFLVGSVHFIDNFAFDHKAEHWYGKNVDHLYRRYFDTSLELAESGIYGGIAHPDSIKLFGHAPSFSLMHYYDKLAKALYKNHMYAEQNSGAARRTNSEIGMNSDMIAAMKRHGVRIITASDAHCPEDVGIYLKEANEIINR